MDLFQPINKLDASDSSFPTFSNAFHLYRVLDAQYALIVVMMACFIFGRTQNSTFLVKIELLMIFIIEVSNIYTGVVEIDGNKTAFKRRLVDVTTFLYFNCMTMAYFYLAFKYWRASKVVNARERVEEGLMTEADLSRM